MAGNTQTQSMDEAVPAAHLPAQKPHYIALDGMRGVASLAVVFFHLELLTWHRSVLAHGGLAVDFFFALSGFVLAYAYAEKLAAGMSAFEFMKRRIIRLYPLAVIGTLIGAVLFALHGGITVSMIVTGVTLLPYPFTYADKFTNWPLNPPMWSLFQEMLASVFFAFAWRYMTFRRLVLLMVVFGVAAVALLSKNSLDHVGAADLYRQTPRTLYAFLAGVIVQRAALPQRWSFLPIWASSIILIGAMALPLGVYWLEALAMILLPTLVALTNRRLSDASAAVFKFLGNLSFPLYALHWPLFIAFEAGGFASLFNNAVLSAGLEFLAAIVLSYAALIVLDEPFRAWLNAALVARARR